MSPAPTPLARVESAALWFLPVTTRVPLKFGPETLTSVTCARVRLTVSGRDGRTAEGWGETPLSVQWVWPGDLPHAARDAALREFCVLLARDWTGFSGGVHPLEAGAAFNDGPLVQRWQAFNATPSPGAARPLPWLAALVCNSAFDLALHDAFGVLVGQPVYDTYGPGFLPPDLASFLTPAPGSGVSFHGRHPCDFLAPEPAVRLPAWHLVGGLDPLHESELTGTEPRDGYPLLLADWIQTDGLNCLKVKLRGTDAAWDYARMVGVGAIAAAHGVLWLSADFNCTVTDPAYVNEILDHLRRDEPRLWEMLLYVEQPFPRDLENHPIDVHSVAARKPLFLDESAHDWRLVRLGRELGWTGVALKTCKTQTGALLMACWARAHGMALMVQDLTNPMLAQIPHVLLAARVGTIHGVETNAMQFYPDASSAEARIHPGLYRRRGGMVDLSSLRGPGFGARVSEIARDLPNQAA